METDLQISGFSLLQLSTTESLLTSSQYAKVIFHNVSENYDSSCDLICCFYSLCNDFKVTPGDRIVLFKLGWQQITDYELFEWAPKLELNEKATVVFKGQYLPKNTYEFYQFCYVNADNAICGASVPFQFSISEAPSTDTVDNKISTSEEEQSLPVEPQPNNECDKPETCTECTKLKQKNELLQSTILNFNSALQKYDCQISDLRKDIASLKSLLSVTQDDVSDFKFRLTAAGDEFKKLYIEKTRTEKKYEKLLKKCRTKKGAETSQPDYDFLEELEPFPVFPFAADVKQI